jgi:murein DD-endopeptidase MepM/ murein hydrolase activator NlpD
MSSLHQVSTPVDGSEPLQGAGSPSRPVRRSAVTTEVEASQIPTPRPGNAQPSGALVKAVTVRPATATSDVVPGVVVVKEAPTAVEVLDPPITGEPEDTEVLVALAERHRLRSGRHRAPSYRGRPVLYVAAALVGALSVSVLAAEEPAARAGTTTVSASVSVAEKLGISADAERPITAADTARLQELAASRNERDAERAEAARVQASADQVAAEAAAAAAAAAAEAARPDAVLPVEGGRLTSGFGGRWGRLHAGIDIAAPMRTPEYTVMDGVVLEAGPASGYGNAVYIQHDNGDVTVYGHMEEILVEAGQVVRAGDTIALLGNRGRSTGPHLHLEVRVGGLDGQKIDPVPWLRERGVDI